jgi:hypothetical protein
LHSSASASGMGGIAPPRIQSGACRCHRDAIPPRCSLPSRRILLSVAEPGSCSRLYLQTPPRRARHLRSATRSTDRHPPEVAPEPVASCLPEFRRWSRDDHADAPARRDLDRRRSGRLLPGRCAADPRRDDVVPVLSEWIVAAERAGVPVHASRDRHPERHPSFR